MRLLVDTSRFADLVASDPMAHALLQRASEVWLSIITIGELLAGFSQGSRRRSNEKRLSDLLQLQGVGVLLLDQETPRYYANVWRSLRHNGTPIPTNDIWIAAQGLQHSLTLDTRDMHFKCVPGLKLLTS